MKGEEGEQTLPVHKRKNWLANKGEYYHSSVKPEAKKKKNSFERRAVPFSYHPSLS